ncbi:MAG: HPr-rel-A system PqqD family peptide chaperone [Pseudomonadota bacterium]
MTHAAALWLSSPAEQLKLKSWDTEDGLAVAYNVRTGDTHLIEDMALQLLGLIRLSPLSVEALAQQLANFFVEHDDEIIQEYVFASLMQLKDIGLVTDVAH